MTENERQAENIYRLALTYNLGLISAEQLVSAIINQKFMGYVPYPHK